MAKLIIVVDKLQDWAPFYQYDGVMSLPDYLKWFFYGLETTWLGLKNEKKKKK